MTERSRRRLPGPGAQCSDHLATLPVVDIDPGSPRLEESRLAPVELGHRLEGLPACSSCRIGLGPSETR
jgi:hypothetical protein